MMNHRPTRLVPVLSESLEPRRLFSALPIVSISVKQPMACGIRGTDACFVATRTGSTDKPLTVHYHLAAASTVKPEQFKALAGTVVIHSGNRSAYIDLVPVKGLIVPVDPTFSLVVERGKGSYARGVHVASGYIMENHGASAAAYHHPDEQPGELDGL